MKGPQTSAVVTLNGNDGLVLDGGKLGSFLSVQDQLLLVPSAVCALVLEFLETFQCLGDPIPMQLELGFDVI